METSFFSYDNQEYLTLAVPDTLQLINVEAIDNPDPSNSPSGLDFTQGFFNFTITGITTPPGNATVTLYLPAGAAPTTYYRYGPLVPGPPEWYEFMFDGTTGAEITDNVITLNFVDGDRGDDDLTPDGTIVDAGGPGSPPASSSGGGGGGGGGGCFIATTTPGLSHIASVPVIIGLFIMVLLFAAGRIVYGESKR